MKKLATAILVFLFASSAHAATIVSAVSATASSSFDAASLPIDNTINQGGLAVNYTSGVTDFDAYIASDPKHTYFSAGAEWFSATRTPTTLVFDLGSLLQIDRIAIWNTERASNSLGNANLSISSDGISFSATGSINPAVNPAGADYSAEVFGFGGSLAFRFLQMDLTDCATVQTVCGLGEIAFSSVSPPPAPVPLPAAGFLLAGALGGLSLMRRREKS